MIHNKIYKCDSESSSYVVLLHGFGGNHKIWKHQIPLLQKYFNVLAIDLPSHYKGNMKLSSLKGNIESVIQEILKVLDEYSIQKAVFMGVSLGTVFIKYLEYFYPQYVKSAILVGAVGAVGMFLHVTVNLFAKIGDKLPALFVYRVFSKVLMPWKVSQKSREIFCKCAEELTAVEFKAYMYIFKEYFSFNKQFLESGQDNNNLYVSGSGDLCFVKGIQKEAKKLKAKLVLMKSCGHVCNIDQKEDFNDVLMEAIIS